MGTFITVVVVLAVVGFAAWHKYGAKIKAIWDEIVRP